ncbi:SsgA family sporulation/cell division regulator [Kitasatospora sp. NPDC058965]|uniref:SsgA family sporulation/cell division regulator n=1 Tax=Kitasatospora sp. NPDC058965 TaxID=3346682 RepID=UPI0036B8E46F
MDDNTAAVSSTIPVELVCAGIGERITFDATWWYDAQDPFAVHVDFLLPLGLTERWSFGRDLLAEGLEVPTGRGDVLIEPDEDHRHVLLQLRGAHGSALLRTEEASLYAFLDRSYAQVPAGAEQCEADLDRWLSGLPDGSQ